MKLFHKLALGFQLVLFCVCLISTASIASAQADSRFASFQKEIDATPVPAVDTTVIAFTVYVNEITLTNKSAGDVTCTILDRQGTPRELYNNVVHPGIYIMPFKGRKMVNGISWSCTGSSAVNGYIQYATGRY